MHKELLNTEFSKAILTGLFLGILSTLLCLIFALFYRTYSGFGLFLIINFPATIFGCNILLLSMGAVYYFFRRMGNRGEAGFVLGILLMTLWCLWAALHIQRSPDPVLSKEFRVLLSGYILILGISIFAGIPICFHSKKFQDAMI